MFPTLMRNNRYPLKNEFFCSTNTNANQIVEIKLRRTSAKKNLANDLCAISAI